MAEKAPPKPPTPPSVVTWLVANPDYAFAFVALALTFLWTKILGEMR